MKITIVGTGHVGLALAVLLARQHQVVALDGLGKAPDVLDVTHNPVLP